MTRNQRNIVAAAVGTAICAGVFVASLLYQFGLLEGVSCVAAWVQLYLLCETAVDALEDRQGTSGNSLVASVMAALVVAAWLGADLLRRGRGL